MKSFNLIYKRILEVMEGVLLIKQLESVVTMNDEFKIIAKLNFKHLKLRDICGHSLLPTKTSEYITSLFHF